MALPQIPLNGRCAGDNRRSTDGSASTRSDCSGPNRGSQAHPLVTIGNSMRAYHGNHPISAICYDMTVWKHLTARNGREFVKHVVPAIVKPARTLWNEVIGFVFMCLAVMFGFRAGRLYLDFSRGATENANTDLGRFALAAFCTLLMLYFGVTSFLRARKISRS